MQYVRIRCIENDANLGLTGIANSCHPKLLLFRPGLLRRSRIVRGISQAEDEDLIGSNSVSVVAP
ncbi:hypothetical protein K432DRAFT_11465 [Lepidopterella palustris CBS 459.81]|uniref:Uncharacterized protein n=1 Tax=Lepidopterella palustris CBS 459.81 TaxID=1314670 RepID=A0A8E2ECW9_9PEZI|nr:hypothetical protein K432DRAFT_11465 [Lepidopterella palustris CBS 459.81]